MRCLSVDNKRPGMEAAIDSLRLPSARAQAQAPIVLTLQQICNNHDTTMSPGRNKLSHVERVRRRTPINEFTRGVGYDARFVLAGIVEQWRGRDAIARVRCRNTGQPVRP